VPQDAEIPPPPWVRLPDRSARRRRDPISRDAIVAAAIRLLDAEGLDALSMRRIADELGTGAASLYWHVGSKDGLLDLVFDQMIGELEVPEPVPGQWREQLKDVARAQRAVTLRHPSVVRISIGRIPMGPNALRYSERVLAILRAGGLPPRLAVQGSHLLISTVNGFTLDETGMGDAAGPASSAGGDSAGGDSAGGDSAGGDSAGGDSAGGDSAGGDSAGGSSDDGIQAAAEVGRDYRAYLASLPAQQFPHLVELADEFSYSDPDERFELLIDIFTDGLARRAAAARAPADGHRDA
jgi:AcrR family transcriptional regulator